MRLQNTTYTGRVRQRAKDDHFHYDRSRAPKLTECETTGLFSGQSLGPALDRQHASAMAGQLSRSPALASRGGRYAGAHILAKDAVTKPYPRIC
jgi:hypothetical protein